MACPSATAPPWTLTFSAVDPELLDHRHGLDGEGLVQLEQIDVLQIPADLLGHALHRFNRRHQHEPWRETAGRLSDDTRERPDAESSRPGGSHHDQRRGPVIDSRGVPGGHGAAVLERGLQSGECFDRCIGPD